MQIKYCKRPGAAAVHCHWQTTATVVSTGAAVTVWLTVRPTVTLSGFTSTPCRIWYQQAHIRTCSASAGRPRPIDHHPPRPRQFARRENHPPVWRIRGRRAGTSPGPVRADGQIVIWVPRSVRCEEHSAWKGAGVLACRGVWGVWSVRPPGTSARALTRTDGTLCGRDQLQARASYGSNGHYNAAQVRPGRPSLDSISVDTARAPTESLSRVPRRHEVCGVENPLPISRSPQPTLRRAGSASARGWSSSALELESIRDISASSATCWDRPDRMRIGTLAFRRCGAASVRWAGPRRILSVYIPRR
ncbi:uncharacterized protein B0H18DRAFT_1030222 [Fomitopsis serialis]|uniref:uncharacterized protein n=1 Tax=Fomitopsis serialis TaxID=139415 RepID=UPI002008BFBB|nr:uncharacterized protein B0H18DRAFT_1030222 [Neoantrodia serialis]KAH9918656.1 hypothetical protein B0H18DRAFT_1030222 [Neoantrodia serialis]